MLLAVVRVVAFMIASPVFPRTVPVLARIGVAVSLALFFTEPLTGSLTLGRLLGAVAVNLTVGAVLGFMTQVVFAMFPTAGGLVDMASGLAISSVFDPVQGEGSAVYNRLFTLLALTLFMVIGGLHLMIQGFALSMDAIPVDGGIRLDAGVVPFAIRATETMIVAGAELALPAMAALFLTEVVLGLGARFAPNANVFILGLPLRILITLVTGTFVVTLFPTAGDASLRMLREAFVASLRGLGVAG
jgi:flagellar biosynthesis protein FliR